jgi:hypothetical protein
MSRYQASRPTGAPDSTSACRFFVDTLASICLRVCFFFVTSVATSLPSENARFQNRSFLNLGIFSQRLADNLARSDATRAGASARRT